jgi:serine phosphatase RsbU (regulator of sigma subunit)
LYAIATSPNGKLVALATQTGGVILADDQLREVARLDGSYLPSPDIYAITFDAQGGLWVAHAKGLSRLATDRDASLLAAESQLGGKVLALAADTRGLWVGTTQGLFRVEQGNVRAISELRGQEVWALQSQNSGITLIGTTAGMWTADGSGGVKSLAVRRAIYAFAEVGGGRVAYGGDRIVGMLNCGSGSCVTEWQDTTQTIEVSSLAPDDKSGLWVGTSVQGTWHRLANGKWEKMTTGVSAAGFSMVTAVGGKVWRFDQSGIHNLSADKAAKLATYLPQGAQYLYGAQEIWATAGGRAPLRLVPDEDNLWDLLMPNPLAVLGKAPTAVAELSKAYFAGKQGSVYRLGTTSDAPVVKAYLHRLIDVSADTILAQFPFEADVISLDYASRNIALEIGLSDLGNPAAIWVQHRLPNGNWSTLKSGGRIELGDLSIGNNTVKVRVLDSYGRLQEIDEFKIRLKAPWYLTIWGILLFVVLLVALVFLVVRLYVRRLEKQKIQLERIVAERTEEVKKQAATIQEQNKEMLDSIRYAQRIQDVMLPSPDFLSTFFQESFLLFRPHSIVSGDFYWYYLNNEHLWLAAADCTGHGVPGAMMSAIGINQLNVIVRQNPNASTYEVLNQLDAGIRNALKQDAGGSQMDGMDIALCKIDLASGKVEFTGANRPLYVLRGQEILIFEADRTAIGGTDVSHFSSQEIVLQPNDRVFMFTDGYPDQMGKLTKRKLGIKRMRTLLEETHTLSLAQQLQKLEQEMKEWQQDEEQTDDMLIMAWQMPA